MEIKSHGEAIELLIKALPYPEHISNIQTEQADRIYFHWRNEKYKLTFKSIDVSRIDNTIEIGDDASILMRQLIKNSLYIKRLNE